MGRRLKSAQKRYQCGYFIRHLNQMLVCRAHASARVRQHAREPFARCEEIREERRIVLGNGFRPICGYLVPSGGKRYRGSVHRAVRGSDSTRVAP